jgi:menaquinone-specific isochorismate synthase
MSFLDLTATILNLLKKQSFQKERGNNHVHIWEHELENVLDLKNLTLHTQALPQCFLASKNTKREDLALGAAKTLRRLDETETLDKYLEQENVQLFGGRRFDPMKNIGNEWRTLGDIYLFLPRIHFITSGNKTKIRINFIENDLIDNGELKPEVLFEIHDTISFTEQSQLNPYFSFDHQLPGESEWGRKINGCLNIFSNGKIGKIVLSRKQIFTAKSNTDLKTQLEKTKVEGNYIFYFKYSEEDAFLSVSPEKLFSIRNGRIEVDALAGSSPRGKSKSDDDRLGDDLLKNQKELNEHRFVTDSIMDSLTELGLKPEFIVAETLLKLPYIQHIHSLISCPLGRHTKILDLMEKLHPTPAVGGSPRELAMESIRAFEPFDRGLYAAPMGIIGKNYSEIIVGIRSALINGKNLHIYGGAGIVPGSTAEREWNETQNKMKAIAGLFS